MEQNVPKIDRTGTVVGEKYKVEKLLARGGFSSVYRAKQLGMDRDVALKILEIKPSVDATTLQRFVREARLVSQLTHPNTITIYDFGQSGSDFLYIAMEYVKGRSLSRQVRKHGALHPMDTAAVCLDILRSLREAHELGILHRDLKPSNIMLGRDHDGKLAVRVLDFGVAKTLQPELEMNTALTQQGSFVGTPRYASPEQMKQEALTPAADIYGVGMIMWECLVGKPAVEGLDFAAAVEGHLSRTPWRLPPDVFCPPGLSHVLYGALEKDPARRYQSCQEMIQDLQRWMADVADHAHVPDPTVEDPLEPADWLGDSFADEVSTSYLEKPTTPAPRRMAELQAPSRAPSMRSDIVEGLALDVSARRPRIQAKPPVMVADEAVVAHRRRSSLGRWAILVVVGLLALAISAWFYGRSRPQPVPMVTAQPVDNSKMIAASGLMLAMKTAGWRLSKFDEATYAGVHQTTFMASKDNLRSTVAIYETDSAHMANALAKDTSQPSEAVIFGRTVVRVSPGPSSASNGVPALTSMLFTFRGMLEDRGEL